MKKGNFDIMGHSIIKLFETRKKINDIHFLILPKFRQLPNLNRKG